jgi:hypothetical protein
MSLGRSAQIGAVLAAGALGLVGSWQAGWLGDRRNGEVRVPPAAPAKAVAHVPSTLPTNGVRINDVVLKRWVSTPRGAMSASQAITAARPYANAQRFPARVLRADVKLRGSPLTNPPDGGSRLTYDGTPSWVITFTSPTPVDVNQGPPGSPPMYVTHFSVALNAVTGAFVLGFFTQ